MRNRWLIAAAAVAIHLSIGSVYAYSVLKNPLSETLGWESTTITGSFSLAIAFLGISAATMGPFVERYGPRAAASFAGVFYGSGMLLAGLATAIGSVPLFYLRLRHYWRDRLGGRLYFAGEYPGEVFPRPPWLGHRFSDYGLWFRFLDLWPYYGDIP